MKFKLVLCSVGLLWIAETSSARCLDQERIVESRRIFLGACEVGKPLALIERQVGYDHFPGGPYSIQIWQGSVIKPVILTETVLERTLDFCARGPNGHRQPRLISQKRFPIRTKMKKVFEFTNNPNLNTGITHNYEMLPLTPAEAASEMRALTQKCHAYSLRDAEDEVGQ